MLSKKTKQDIKTAAVNYQHELIDDIVAMLSYARNSGIEIPDDLRAEISKLFEAPELAEMMPTSALDESSISKSDAPAASSETPPTNESEELELPDKLQTEISVHGQLCQLIKPVTPSSIRGSRFFENEALILTSLVAACSFIWLLVAPQCTPAASSNPCELNNSNIWGILGAAALGSAFYALTSAAPYLQKGTFEPRYNQTYTVRLVIGICAGVILGLFSTELNISSDLGQKGLALVGGFSAEAVVQILKRIAETLVTAVRGSNKDQAKAEIEKGIAEKEKDLVKKKIEIGNALHETLSMPDTDKKQAIQGIIKNLAK